MRFNLAALANEQSARGSYLLPLTVKIKPSRGIMGEHLYSTDSRALLTMLKRTDLSGYMLDEFTTTLRSEHSARLSGVELNDHALREIGYFVD